MSMIKINTLLGSIKDELLNLTSLSEVKNVVRHIDKNINNDDDWNFFEGTAIWTGKGKSKTDNPRYVAMKQRMTV